LLLAGVLGNETTEMPGVLSLELCPRSEFNSYEIELAIGER
jgi:hypothetical protein